MTISMNTLQEMNVLANLKALYSQARLSLFPQQTWPTEAISITPIVHLALRRLLGNISCQTVLLWQQHLPSTPKPCGTLTRTLDASAMQV